MENIQSGIFDYIKEGINDEYSGDNPFIMEKLVPYIKENIIEKLLKESYHLTDGRDVLLGRFVLTNKLNRPFDYNIDEERKYFIEKVFKGNTKEDDAFFTQVSKDLKEIKKHLVNGTFVLDSNEAFMFDEGNSKDDDVNLLLSYNGILSVALEHDTLKTRRSKQRIHYLFRLMFSAAQSYMIEAMRTTDTEFVSLDDEGLNNICGEYLNGLVNFLNYWLFHDLFDSVKEHSPELMNYFYNSFGEGRQFIENSDGDPLKITDNLIFIKTFNRSMSILFNQYKENLKVFFDRYHEGKGNVYKREKDMMEYFIMASLYEVWLLTSKTIRNWSENKSRYVDKVVVNVNDDELITIQPINVLDGVVLIDKTTMFSDDVNKLRSLYFRETIVSDKIKRDFDFIKEDASCTEFSLEFLIRNDLFYSSTPEQEKRIFEVLDRYAKVMLDKEHGLIPILLNRIMFSFNKFIKPFEHHLYTSCCIPVHRFFKNDLDLKTSVIIPKIALSEWLDDEEPTHRVTPFRHLFLNEQSTETDYHYFYLDGIHNLTEFKGAFKFDGYDYTVRRYEEIPEETEITEKDRSTFYFYKLESLKPFLNQYIPFIKAIAKNPELTKVDSELSFYKTISKVIDKEFDEILSGKINECFSSRKLN